MCVESRDYVEYSFEINQNLVSQVAIHDNRIRIKKMRLFFKTSKYVIIMNDNIFKI